MRFEHRNETAAWLCGLACGMGILFFLDPASGRRRRARMRDKALHAGHDVGGWLAKRGRDLGSRAYGQVASLRARLRNEPVDDSTLVERVRANLGHVVEHPETIEVQAEDGRVSLSGRVAAHELPGLLARVWSVPGVCDLDNQLMLEGDLAVAGEPETGSGMRWLLIGGAAAVVTLALVSQRDRLGQTIRRLRREEDLGTRVARSLRGLRPDGDEVKRRLARGVKWVRRQVA